MNGNLHRIKLRAKTIEKYSATAKDCTIWKLKIMKRVNDMIEKIKNAREVWNFVVSIVVAVVVSTGWMSAMFVTTSSAKETHRALEDVAAKELKKTNDQLAKLSRQVTASNELLMLHIDKHTLESVNLALNGIETEMFNIEQFVRVNGPDARSGERLHKLRGEKEALNIRRSCIINKNEVCK